MPLLNFLKVKQPELLSIDITRNRSTDSQLDATAPGKKTVVAPPSSPPRPASASPAASATTQSSPWRTKELSSIVRPSLRASAEETGVESQIQEDFWTIKRCDAFDEDDDDYDDDYRY